MSRSWSYTSSAYAARARRRERQAKKFIKTAREWAHFRDSAARRHDVEDVARCAERVEMWVRFARCDWKFAQHERRQAASARQYERNIRGAHANASA